MIIAGRNRGRIHAASTALDGTALSATRSAGASAQLPGVSATPRTGASSELRRLREALPRGRAAAAGARSASLSFDSQAAVPALLLVLALSAFIPGARFELQTAADQAAVETAATLISLLAAILFFQRFWRHLRLRSLLLAGGLTVIAGSNLGAVRTYVILLSWTNSHATPLES